MATYDANGKYRNHYVGAPGLAQGLVPGEYPVCDVILELSRQAMGLALHAYRPIRLGPSHRRLAKLADLERALAEHQVPLGDRFIVDFVALSAKLVVEVDGRQHERHSRADPRRDRVLGPLGYRVLRLEAALVLRDPPEAVARVRAALAA